MPQGTIYGMFRGGVARYGDKILLKFKEGGMYRGISWNTVDKNVTSVAIWLTGSGIKKGNKVAILSENRPEWVFADLAILALGAVNVPIYATDTPQEIEYILRDSSSKVIFVSTQEQLDKVLKACDELSELEHIVLFDEPKGLPAQNVYPLKDILSADNRSAAQLKSFSAASEGVRGEDIASIIYTSGTTGEPKGVMLTHDNFLSNCRSSAEALSFSKEDLCLSLLPLSHVFERMAGYYMLIMHGGTIAYAENINTFAENIKEVNPTVVCAVPRLFEKVYSRIVEAVLDSPFIKRKVFFWAVERGRALMRRELSPDGRSIYTKLERSLLNSIVFNKIKASFGNRLRFFISGGAPLSKEIAEFFYAVGIMILEGYGLTESSPVISANTPAHLKLGSVGMAIPGIEVRIAGDGEILTRGPHVMAGYYKKEGETRQAIRGGWLHTGDIGYIDRDGFIVITDRKKEIIVTSGGKNIPPQKVENLIKADRFISEVMVYGDKRNYLVALIVPDFQSISKYADYKGIRYSSIEELIKDPRITGLIERRISKRSKGLASFEQIKRFALLERPLSQSKGELTPTLKIKRKAVAERYSRILEELYK